MRGEGPGFLAAFFLPQTLHTHMAAASSLMQEEGPYGASDRLDHPYGWTVVDPSSMYSNKTTLNPHLNICWQVRKDLQLRRGHW